MSKKTTFGPVVFGEWYDSKYSKLFRFARVTQTVQTRYTSGGDETYAGKHQDHDTVRSAFTKWDIDAKKEDFLTDILGKEGRGRIIRVLGCDLFSVLTEDQRAEYDLLVEAGAQEDADNLMAKWSENMLRVNDKGEILKYHGLDMYGQYFYRLDSNSPDIDIRASDFARIQAMKALEQEMTVETPASSRTAVKVPAGLVAESAEG